MLASFLWQLVALLDFNIHFAFFFCFLGIGKLLIIKKIRRNVIKIVKMKSFYIKY